jgi:hypothetical protein
MRTSAEGRKVEERKRGGNKRIKENKQLKAQFYLAD